MYNYKLWLTGLIQSELLFLWLIDRETAALTRHEISHQQRHSYFSRRLRPDARQSERERAARRFTVDREDVVLQGCASLDEVCWTVKKTSTTRFIVDVTPDRCTSSRTQAVVRPERLYNVRMGNLRLFYWSLHHLLGATQINPKVRRSPS
jgi:hypothetical protein